jgi:hypothetical protein
MKLSRDSPVSTKVARVDGLGVPDDLAHGGTSIPDDTRGKDLLALTTNDNTIAVGGPRNIFNKHCGMG